jgi:uncharacterized protein
MPINASFEYMNAEKRYSQAVTLEQKIAALQEMIREAPAHKGGESLRAELKTRLKKFLEKQEKGKKVGKGAKGIRKEGFQVAIVGLANSGKSCLMKKLTNAEVIISEVAYSSREPIVGMMEYSGVRAQLIDFPAIEGKDIDFGTLNTSDCLMIVVSSLDDVEKVEKFLFKATGKRIIVLNKIDLLSETERRKVEARMKSRKIDGVIVSCFSGEGIEDLKGVIFSKMGVIRVYTKEPGKVRSEDPVVLPSGASVKDVAESIRKGFSLRVKEARLTGPSGKFANQRVGLGHVCKDRDVVEFK